MKLAEVAVLAESGELVWAGSLTDFCRANPPVDRRALCRDLRDGITTPHGRPEPAVIGGGAAPMFYVSLVS